MKKHIILPLFIFSLLINFPIKSKSSIDYIHAYNWLSSGIAAASFIDISESLKETYKEKNELKKISRYFLASLRTTIAYDIIISILDSDKCNEIIAPEFLSAVGAYLVAKSADIAIDRYC